MLPYTHKDSMLINSGPFNELSNEEAMKKMTAYAEEHGFGKATVTYRLKDWGISRQRYWGTPIPMLYCEKDGIVPVPENQLPVLLPDNVRHHARRRLSACAHSGIRQCHVSQMRRSGASRDRYHGHLR